MRPARSSAGAIQPNTLLVYAEPVSRVSLYVSLAIIYAWFGGMKFTAYEAQGLVPLVENSPILSWFYAVFSVRGFSTFLGFVELSIGLLIALRLASPMFSAAGGLLSAGLFVTTLSFMISTPRRRRAGARTARYLGCAGSVPPEGCRPVRRFVLGVRRLAEGRHTQVNNRECRLPVRRRLRQRVAETEESIMKLRSIFGATIAAFAIATATPAAAHGGDETVVVDFERAIPNIPGKSLVAVEVTYPPGGASSAHTHAKSAFIYAHVVSGQIESKVNDEPARVYKAGESYETPGSHHGISRNASKTEPAKLLAVFVVDNGEVELTTPDQDRTGTMTQRLDYTQVSPAGVKAFGSVYGYIMQSGLDPTLVDLVYLRVSPDQRLRVLPRHAHARSPRQGRGDRKARAGARRGAKRAHSSTSASARRWRGPSR